MVVGVPRCAGIEESTPVMHGAMVGYETNIDRDRSIIIRIKKIVQTLPNFKTDFTNDTVSFERIWRHSTRPFGSFQKLMFSVQGVGGVVGSRGGKETTAERKCRLD